jgi:glucokinase
LAPTVDSSVLVYDVGGSHISAAVCHANDYSLGPVLRAAISDIQTSDGFVDLIHALGVKASAGVIGILGAELANPGPFDYAQGISWVKHKLPYLYGVNLSQAVAQRFGWEPAQVRFLNDAAAYLLGEVGAGAATGVARVVGITLGTGVGSAFAVDGRIVTEGPGIPHGGEIWDTPYKGGIVEDLISTRAIQRSYQERTGKEREVASIAHYAGGGEPIASEVFAEFGRTLGTALKDLFTEFAPDVVVIGGGISQSAHLFLPAAKASLEGVRFEVRISSLRENAALVGAGVAWFGA